VRMKTTFLRRALDWAAAPRAVRAAVAADFRKFLRDDGKQRRESRLLFVMDMVSIGRDLEAVAGVRGPLFLPRRQSLAFRAVSVVLRLVGLFERIVVQIEEQPGAALEADVFPAVPRHDSAVWCIDAVGMPRGDHVLQVRGIRLRSRGRAVPSIRREIGALHRGPLLNAVEAL